jgi:hypothetical protein
MGPLASAMARKPAKPRMEAMRAQVAPAKARPEVRRWLQGFLLE